MTTNSYGKSRVRLTKILRQGDNPMPNQHRIPVNLEPFKLENKNQIFITTDEPYGLISATISRKTTSD